MRSWFTPPENESDLEKRCQMLAGMTFGKLASELGLIIPDSPCKRKGWLGMAMELAMGATSGNLPMPDFSRLGIELKTIPLSKTGNPAETTFITSIPLLTIHRQQWENSQCLSKLRRILWIPVEGDPEISYVQRRIGKGFLWSPSDTQMQVLRNDWILLTDFILTGQLELLDARHGEYLQVRPKGMNGKSLSYGFDTDGNKIKTLPRGFYLRTSFTKMILQG